MWGFVSKGIADIQRLCGDPKSPEFVYHQILSERAALFILHEEKPAGFCVLEQCQFAPGYRYVNAWLLHSVNRIHGDARRDFLAWLDEMAGDQPIRFVSPRKGWIKFLGKDFEIAGYIFERKKK